MNPDHSALAIPRARQPQRLAPYLALVLLQLVDFFRLFFFAAFLVFVVAGRPSLLSCLVHEFGGVLLEDYEGEEGEFIVGGYFDGGSGDDHGA